MAHSIAIARRESTLLSEVKSRSERRRAVNQACAQELVTKNGVAIGHGADGFRL
jgi:hypothetical protein